MNGRVLSVSCAAALLAATAGAETGPPRGAETQAPSLYARIGGYDVVAKFVDTAFPRVAGHPQLRRLFQGHSQDSQVRQRQLVIDAFCQATGGPCAYTGRAMKPVHTGLGITAADWKVFTDIVRHALEELGVAPGEKAEFLDLLDHRFREVVVEVP